MKYWLSHLPLEVWVEIFSFPWIRREDMGRIVDRIGNYKFAEYLQFYLHDWGKQKLNFLYFREDGLYRFVCYEPYWPRLDFPLTPMPANIKTFETLTIDHFDAHTIAFLRQIRHLLHGINCRFNIEYMDAAALRTLFAHLQLMPMMRRIRSIGFNEGAIPIMEHHLGERLAQIRVLRLHLDYRSRSRATVNFVVNWLSMAGPDWHGAKLCALEDCRISMLGRIEDEIYERFIVAKSPCTFAVDIRLREENDEDLLRGIKFENAIGEQLLGFQVDYGKYGIARYQAKDMNDLEKWIVENLKYSGRCIKFGCPTIGKFDEDDDHQPPASKKRRMSMSI